MSEQQIYFLIIKIVTVAIPIIVGLISIGETLKKPVKELRGEVTKLNNNFYELNTELLRSKDADTVQNRRLDKHGEQIDEAIIKIENHEHRIGTVEKDIEELKENR
ncbi:hypothetical protein [Peptostreptococcus faecalis]|uniref:hypothetical protein n=1 Tax=Peptostreptococcus faecalis TaxID=2045015 RepID=UPI000C7A7E1C|nr:hypothetical protein [Peptostreptococcus faecalis]